MRVILVCAATLVLCACNPGGGGKGSGLIPPADAPANPSEPAAAPASAEAPVAEPVEPAALAERLDGNGTEPFWSFKIRRYTIVLSRPDQTDVIAVNPGMTRQGDQWTWRTTTAAKGDDLSIVVAPAKCSNGMTDKTFPYSVVIQLGGDTLKGCAELAAAKP